MTRYVETTFTRADLVQAMHEYINDMVRKLGQDALKGDVVYNCLISESGAQVDKYAGDYSQVITVKVYSAGMA